MEHYEASRFRRLLADVCSAIKQGCKEIQLTAQDTASYGLDIGTNLGTLLTHLCPLDSVFRIRVGMMNPQTVQKNIDSILTAYQHYKIYKFLHLPVQSGDDEILKKMNRGYTAKDFTCLVEQFRKKIPTLTLSTDVIIGFPTETEEQFYQDDRTVKTNKTRYHQHHQVFCSPTHRCEKHERTHSYTCGQRTIKTNNRNLLKNLTRKKSRTPEKNIHSTCD